MLTVFIRTIIIYFSLIITIRLMGKRQIGELQLSEFIITFLLSEIASVPITDKSASLIDALLPIFFLLIIELTVSYILLKNNFIRKLLVGTPSLLILRGEIIQKEMKKNRIEIEELLASIRQNGCSCIGEVRYAILEENGKITVIPNKADAPVTPRDIGREVLETGIAHPIILDGNIVRENMHMIGWDENRLYRELRKRRVYEENVFLMTVDDAGNITVIKRKIPNDS
ncbi:MAG: DUF421 domain-containing protein [Clostridia bacterium]|nr:DUF421 domain-containing protein [Clostridia bacterium]